MSDNMKSLLWGVAIGVIAIIAIELIFTWTFVISLAIGLVVGAVGVTVIKAMASGENSETAIRDTVAQARAVVQEPETATKERRANQQLHTASVAFVTSGAAPGLVKPLEGIVEPLRELVSRALEFAPGSETTFNLVKLATEDLPQILGQFVDMSAADRSAKQADLEEQFSSLTNQLKELTAFVDQGRAADFDAQSMFINLKFG